MYVNLILILAAENGCFELTSNVIWFSRTYVHFIENLSFNVTNIMHDVEQAICDVLLRFIGHITASLRSDNFQSEVGVRTVVR